MLRVSEPPPATSGRPAAPDVRRRSWLPALVLAGLVVVSAGLRFWGALAVPSPWFTPDEEVYAELGRSLWSEGRFEILGVGTQFYGLVYPALAGLPLNLGDVELGYGLLKAIQALVLSLVAVPVYLWGGSLMAPRWALVAAALSLALPGLAFAGFVMTEVAFYPVLCLAAWAVARALARPSVDRQLIAVAAILLAALTRIQAIVLVPAFFLALALQVTFARTWLRGARPFWPAATGLLVLSAGWIAATSLGGSRALGVYAVTGETSYGLREAVRFGLYHAGDLVLLTAVLPVVALALLAVPAFRGREPSRDVQAYVATTLALSLGFVASVGLFASRFLGRLAERNLIALAPLLFLAFALWLDRGAPRPRLSTALAAASAVALLAVVPWGDFVTRAAQPDAFSVIPLYWMRLWYPDLDVTVVVLVAAVELLALLALVPKRARWLLPATVIAVLAGAAIAVTTEVADEARGFREVMIGPDLRWVDRSAGGPVSYVFAGEQPWSAGGPVWVHLFWNRRIDRVYQLFGARIAGPAPPAEVRPTADGRLLDKSGRAATGPYALASTRLAFVGERLAVSPAQLALWRVEPPLRLSTRHTGIDPAGGVGPNATVIAYDCRTGELRLTLRSQAEQTVRLTLDGRVVQTVELPFGEPWTGAIQVPQRPASAPARVCRFGLRGASRPLTVEQVEFVRAAQR